VVFALEDKVMEIDKEYVWLAASDIACTKKFVWCSGAEVLANFRWSAFQPSYSPDENCLSQYIEFGFIKNHGFSDIECAKLVRYFCK
jgi:hypothetical protein